MRRVLALAVVLALVSALGGGCRSVAPAANAAGPSVAVPDFIRVGGVYTMWMTSGSQYGDSYEVVEIRPDGWIRVGNPGWIGDPVVWIHISHVAQVWIQ